MVKVSYEQKPYRKNLMQVWGAKVYPSPTTLTESGRKVLEMDPASMGSLGIAISEAVEMAVKDEHTKYTLGSVLNHVLLHQTIIGLEVKEQLKLAGEKKVDALIGCVGGGSNFPGLVFPFMKDKYADPHMKLIAVEPTSCPTLTKGEYRYDLGDVAGFTPLMKMYTLGHSFMPPGIHAGGLRYHGDAPLLCNLVHDKFIEAKAYNQTECFEAALLFAREEGILPAPESSHAIKGAIEEAKHGGEKVIVFNLSGHGYFDLAAYDAYLSGNLRDVPYAKEKIAEALRELPVIK